METVNLPCNILHARALDLGFLRARTEFVVALDVDAFPIFVKWLNVVLDPLAAGATVCGGRFRDRHLDYAHPCFMAMRTERFVSRRHSFREVRQSGDLVIDTGAAITMREGLEVVLIDPSSVRGPGIIGTVYGGVVYHNFFGTRLKDVDSLELVELANQARSAWDEAVAKYL